MKIEVRIDDNVVFLGLAEDYLFMNDNDVELELLLDKLDRMEYNSIVRLEDRKIKKTDRCVMGGLNERGIQKNYCVAYRKTNV